MKLILNHFSFYLFINLFLNSFNHSIRAQDQNFAQINEPIISLINHEIDQNQIELKLKIELSPNQFIYADSIDLSIDQPNIDLLDIKIDKNPQKSRDPKLQNILVYSGNFTITSLVKLNQITSQHTNTQGNLHFSYLLTNQKHVTEKIYPIALFKNDEPKTAIKPSQISKQLQDSNTKPAINNNASTSTLWEKVTKFSRWIQTLLRTSESISLRLLLVFLLGFLMSLTPCIYPMIPITAGILQAQNSSSIGRSFLLALTYTLGTSTTFAIFGLIAALTGHLFGQLLVNPIFILIMATLLSYLGLSMFGLYDMYVPKFMAGNHDYAHKKSSLLSVFIFGAISGSMASPCLSPGLALLLSIVATLGNNLLGFLMLFIFGLGLSVPLLIVGTFSNSINMIPQNGAWMVEIKKIFGFMLLGMSIYLLSNILSIQVISWLVTLFIFGSGIYYLQNASIYDGKTWHILKNSLGILLIILAVLLCTQNIYKFYFNTQSPYLENNWQTNYPAALAQANTNNQKLLIDCGAQWCSICKAIDKKVLQNPVLQSTLSNLVLLKVDATDQDSEPYLTLKNKYQILGVPAILLIDPTNHQILKRWGSELYDLPINEFMAELE